MSNPTANWFLPTRTWKRLTQDYALVNHPAAPIRRELRMHDRLPHDHYADFQDYADDWYNHRYKFSPCGYSKLVYADVDQSSPAHKALVKRWAEEPEAETKDASIVEEKEKLIAAAREKFGFIYGTEAPEGEASASNDTDSNSISDDSAVLADLRHQITCERSWPLKYIMKLPSRSAKESVLRILSDQTHTRTVRPVMLLLDMLDSCQSTTAGETHGWVSAYDFLDNVLVIKPFVSRPGHHPLGDAWFGPVANDGVSFKGSPQELLTLVTDDASFGAADAPNRNFSRIVRMEAAGWVMEYGKSLRIDVGVVKALASEEGDREERCGDGFAGTAFPNREKKCGYEDADRIKLLYEAGVGGMESAEIDFRNAAVEAKEEGRGKEVENLVAFYEKTMGELKALMEDPGR